MEAISATQAQKLVATGAAQLVDIRETVEYKQLFIENSLLAPLSVFPLLTMPESTKPPIFFCHSGRRTQANLHLLASKKTQSYWMEGGISAWITAGLPVNQQHTSLPVMRQVHIVAGGLILASMGLTMVWHSAFWVACAVGAGLLLSGITGTCVMQTVLNKMPWNKGI